MYGYTKLFQSIITSTVWQESNDVKAVWVTMLALKDGDHICRATIPALAKLNNLTNEDTEEILKKLQSPDPYSRSKEFGGRRIEPTPEGWLILNGAKYQSKMNEDERREYKRLWAKGHRNKKKMESETVDTASTNVDKCRSNWTKSTHSDSDTDTETKEEYIAASQPFEFWEKYPKRNGRKSGKKEAYAQWKKLTEKERAAALRSLSAQIEHKRKCDEAGEFCPEFPDAWRWLRNKRFLDEVGGPVTNKDDWKERFLKAVE